METPPPSLHDLYGLPAIEAIAFWCTVHTCQHHDTAPTGVLAIDYGPATTLPDMERVSFCLKCYGQVQVRPRWKAVSRSLVG